ncbi:alpha/beta fold hydrolase [Gilvimarinus sp. DA14]|uniref:alpha/beta fold hydrolase n=1 Tax=Gilvimarinus sp. DA14 TaxID=2956798 RepID=UPI0020B66601|nr:alpha/beta hydrolase [Gilvimarinus sp. DA14]UTF59581.1 alpha/beta hydrolase [Gilvimarinus sp. DA14]
MRRACLLILALLICAASVGASPLPANWHSGYAAEPVFNGKVFWVEAGKENPDTILLVHGLGQNGWRDWQELIPLLARDYRVLAIDLPGFGRSSAPAGKYSPENYARMIKALVDKAGIQRFALIGHSMGANVALRFSTRNPNYLTHLVLISAAGILERSSFAQYSAAMPLQSDLLPALQQLPEPLRDNLSLMARTLGGDLLRWDALPDPDLLLNTSDNNWATALQGRPNLNAALALVQENYSGELNKLTLPSLILWGEDDPLTPLRTGQLLNGQLPNSRLKTFANMGHMPIHYPELIYPVIEEFFTSQNTAANKPLSDLKQKGDFHCSGQNNQTLSGRYSSIHIDRCDNIQLYQVQAQSVYISQSQVSMLDVSITNPGTGLQVEQSKVSATNLKINAERAIVASQSELDLAGASLVGEKSALTNLAPNLYIFSVSDINSAGKSKLMHGVYRLGAP